eukprot:m.233619 g.233619  ORF g.233619 m.233619 type:complete len:378 (+) comp13909_c0_seq1:253-1386(+)
MHIHLDCGGDDSPCSFDTEFTHQVIGETEKIFGYEGLNVKISYCCGSLRACVSLTYDECISDEDEFAKPDNVIGKVKQWMAPDTITDVKEFQKIAQEDAKAFKPIGTQIASNLILKDNKYDIFMASAADEGFKEFHARAQTFPIWMIERGSWLDLDDTNWRVFYMFEHKDEQSPYKFVAMTTVYNYLAYPDQQRPRISQHLVLPPYQGAGVGTCLLRNVQKLLRSEDTTKDITVESPSDVFSFVRDRIDCKDALNLDEIKELDYAHVTANEGTLLLQNKLKLCKPQARRVFEILLLMGVINGKAEKDKFENIVKNRLSQSYYREHLVKQKLLHSMNQKEQIALKRRDQEEKYQLRQAFDDLQETYAKVALSISNIQY